MATMATPNLRINDTLPVANRTVHDLEQANRQRMHLQRLHDISVAGKRRADLGNSWRVGPQRSRPTYAHLRDNLKKQQVESERFDAIEHENRLLLDKMSALMASGSVLDPTEGTWEFQPGVRLNRFQMPVIDHGSTRQPESLNWGARRRELERITAENRGIVNRIQGRSSYYPSSQWPTRSDEHDRHLLLIRRPATSATATLPTPPSPLASSLPKRRPRSNRGGLPRGMGKSMGPQQTSVLSDAKEGDAHLLLGLASGIAAGTTLIVRPQEPEEEAVCVHETWLRKDGLVVLMKEPLQRAHPAGAYVLAKG